MLFPVSIAFTDAQHGWLMIEPDHGMNSSPGQLFATTDGGASWFQVASTGGNKDGLPFGGTISFRDSSTGWVAGVFVSTTSRHLYRTEDGGRTWQPQKLELPLGYTDGKIDVGAPVFFPPQAKEGILTATFVPESYKTTEYATIIYVTRDGGQTWQSGKPTQPMGMTDFRNPDEGWQWRPEPRDSGSTAPVKGELYRTSDGGQTWAAVSPSGVLQQLLENGQDIEELEFINENTGWVLVSANAAQPKQLLQTTDGGENWTRVYPQ